MIWRHLSILKRIGKSLLQKRIERLQKPNVRHSHSTRKVTILGVPFSEGQVIYRASFTILLFTIYLRPIVLGGHERERPPELTLSVHCKSR